METDNDTVNCALLTVRRFKAKLPNDFAQLVSVETEPSMRTFVKIDNNKIIGNVKREAHDTFLHISNKTEMFYKGIRNRQNVKTFCLRNDEILFNGSYSKYFFVRWIQLLKEWIAPQKVVLKYIAQ